MQKERPDNLRTPPVYIAVKQCMACGRPLEKGTGGIPLYDVNDLTQRDARANCFFVNAASFNLLFEEVVEQDGIEPTTSSLQS
jgi:hypothetical protein